jgi:hypothetical protein
LAWLQRATGFESNRHGAVPVLYLTAIVTVLSLIYLAYAMIRPESF